MTDRVPLVCGVGQPGRPCNESAVGALAVHVHPDMGVGERKPAVLLVCVRHLADFHEQAAAVFPPGAGTKGA